MTRLSLSDVHSLFQPIVELRSSSLQLFGTEALSRGPESTMFFDAGALFAHFRAQGDEIALDRRCLESAIEAAQILPSDLTVTLNVMAPTLAQRDGFETFLLGLLVNAGIDPSRVILEINEGAPVRYALPDILRTLDTLRAEGVRVALDDLGEGYANYRTILDLRPDFLKIDRYFIHRAAEDSGRQAIIASICELANYFGSRVIAEGVEKTEDFLVASDLGIRLYQGFLFSRPVAASAIPGRFASILEKRGMNARHETLVPFTAGGVTF
jgi:EAL domain-containing protein (putative c-di-GMP-specific phosphodiesterase class I)